MKTQHLILACHMLDREKMIVLLKGMEAHSQFFCFDMNEAFNGPVEQSFNEIMPRPLMDMWHGHIPMNFDHEVLCGLLESVRWTFPDCVFVSMTFANMRGGLITRSPGEYRTAFDLGQLNVA